MAEDINRVMMVGRLTRDSELKYTNSGFPISQFSIAVNRSRKQNDQWIEEPNFFDCSIFGKRAESLNQYLTKGQQVGIEGKLKQDRWEQEGQKRSKVFIEVSQIQLLGKKQESQGGNSYQQNSQQYAPPEQPSGDRFEDDIPF